MQEVPPPDLQSPNCPDQEPFFYLNERSGKIWPVHIGAGESSCSCGNVSVERSANYRNGWESIGHRDTLKRSGGLRIYRDLPRSRTKFQSTVQYIQASSGGVRSRDLRVFFEGAQHKRNCGGV
jgi:hypothetical protein